MHSKYFFGQPMKFVEFTNSLNKPFSSLVRVLHWLIVLSFLVLLYTEITNMYFYGKEAILKSFEFSFPAVGLQDVPPLDRLFIARLERRETWMWHFWAGAMFVCLVALRFFIFLASCQKRNKLLHISLFLIVLVQFGTGYTLWAYDHIYEWQNITRDIHHCTVYVMYLLVLLHIANILKLELTSHRGIISKMIGGDFR